MIKRRPQLIRKGLGISVLFLFFIFSAGISQAQEGSVWLWGNNLDGQLGNGSFDYDPHPVPSKIDGLDNAVAITGGSSHSVVLTSDGTVWSWGNNMFGQLGNGTFTQKNSSPAPISSLTGVIAISSGGYSTLALKSDGTVWSWGNNYYGQLGDGTAISKNTPVNVTGLSEIISIASGGQFSMALRSDGTVCTWGRNPYGQLGNGTADGNIYPYPVHPFPGHVLGLGDVTSISGGGNHGMALMKDGTVWTWGINNRGQLGDGTFTQRNTPVKVYGLEGVKTIAAGHAHSMALSSNGEVWVWGILGNSNRPIKVEGLNDIVAIDAGNDFSLAIKSDGTLWAWGWNPYGQLGDGTTENKNIPTQLRLGGVFAIAAAGYHGMALQASQFNDTMAPVLEGMKDLVYDAIPSEGAVVYYNVTATDLVDPAPDVVCLPKSGSTFPAGVTTVICKATDFSGNVSTGSFTVTVRDVTLPTVTPPADITAEAQDTLTYVCTGKATATDNIGVVSITSDAPASFPLGTTTVTWTAMDAAGNIGTAIQKITVKDTTAPVIDNPRCVNVLLNTTANDPVIQGFLAQVFAYDLVDKNVQVTYVLPSSFDTVGFKIVAFTASDSHGNKATSTGLIRVNYSFGGFLSPLGNGSLFKQGSDVPVKFKLEDANGKFVPNANPKVSLTKVSDYVPTGEPVSLATNVDGLVFESTGNLYNYNLDTSGLTTGFWRVTLELDDMTNYYSYFSIKQ